LRRHLLTLLLILSLCWQPLAQAGSPAAWIDSSESAHTMMHFDGVGHHHDGESGDIHQDDSPASLQHLLDDAGMNAPALMPHVSIPLGLPTPCAIDAGVAMPAQALLADGLERPPRSGT
jgi:hypothetical protein